jgi:hypothetical protein
MGMGLFVVFDGQMSRDLLNPLARSSLPAARSRVWRSRRRTSKVKLIQVPGHSYSCTVATTRGSGDRIGKINLIDWTSGVKQGRAISADVRDDVHDVREYRNFPVHERDDQSPPAAVAIEAARKRLNTLLHCLPIQW